MILQGHEELPKQEMYENPPENTWKGRPRTSLHGLGNFNIYNFKAQLLQRVLKEDFPLNERSSQVVLQNFGMLNEG